MFELLDALNVLQTNLIDPNKFNNYLLLGYFVMWLIVMIYIFTLANRQNNASEEIKLLKQLLEEDEESTVR